MIYFPIIVSNKFVLVYHLTSVHVVVHVDNILGRDYLPLNMPNDDASFSIDTTCFQRDTVRVIDSNFFIE